MAEEISHRASRRKEISKGVVGVLCHDVPVGIEIMGNVAVVVVEGEIELELRVGVGDREAEQSSNATSAFKRT